MLPAVRFHTIPTLSTLLRVLRAFLIEEFTSPLRLLVPNLWKPLVPVLEIVADIPCQFNEGGPRVAVFVAKGQNRTLVLEAWNRIKAEGLKIFV